MQPGRFKSADGGPGVDEGGYEYRNQRGDDVEALLNHLRVPWRHRKHVRTTNLIERSFVEERRRTKTIPRFFTEKSGLKLVYATLIRAADNGQRVGITATERAPVPFQSRG